MKTALILLALALTGCSSITGSRTAPDGSKLVLQSHRFFWSSEGLQFTLTDTNGFTVGLGVQKSNPDADALRAVATGISEGLGKAALSTVKPPTP